MAKKNKFKSPMNKVIKVIQDAAFTNDLNAIAKTYEESSTTYHFSFLTPNKVIDSIYTIAAVRFSIDQVNIYLYDAYDLENETNLEITNSERYFYTAVVSDKDAVLVLDIINANEELLIEVQ